MIYSGEVNTISISQRIQGNVGDGFLLAFRLSAGGEFVRQSLDLPFVEVTTYLDNQPIGYTVTIDGDLATVVYAGGRLHTSAGLLTILARIRTGTGLTAILDDISLYTWPTENSENSLCTNDGQTYTSQSGLDTFVMLCHTGLPNGDIYRVLPAAGYSQCLELCVQQGTICAGVVWTSDNLQCALYNRTGLQETGSPESHYRNSAIRLTGGESDARNQQLQNGGFDTGTPSSWTVEDGRSGDLDVAANMLEM